MTKHFTSKVKDVQLPHYCISKSHVAFRDVLAVANACPSIFSKLFTVNKVKFIVKVIFSSLTMMESACLSLFFTGDASSVSLSFWLPCNNIKNKQTRHFTDIKIFISQHRAGFAETHASIDILFRHYSLNSSINKK